MVSWQIVRESLGACGTVLGAWALIRTYLQSRPCLRLSQQARSSVSYQGTKEYTKLVAYISLMICNPRPTPNAIVDWRAEVKLPQGKIVEIPVPSGRIQFCGGGPLLEYGETPVVVASGAAVHTNLCLLAIPADTPLPLNIKLTATDAFSKKYRLKCLLNER